jgi:hypothetical protein
MKVGAANRHRAGAFPEKGEPEEVLEQMPVRADAKKPFAHHFKGGHLLDVVRDEVLKLQPVREQHPADEPVVDAKSAPYAKHTATRKS